MENNKFHNDMIMAAIRIGLLAYLIVISYRILEPFLVLIAWGAIIATALYPMHKNLTGRFNGGKKRSAVIITLVALAVLIVPCYFLAGSLIDTAQSIGEKMQDGSIDIPPPKESVAEWPVVGEKVYNNWSDASANIQDYTRAHAEQIKSIGEWMLKAAGSTVTSILLFIASIILAGVLLNFAEACRDSLYQFTGKLVRDRAEILVDNAAKTIQSVAKGILGTAFIQTILCTVGMIVVGVPGVGLWAILVLLLAIAQLPPTLIMIPVSIYVFSAEPAWIAWIFFIYSFIASSSDSVLKPLLLGRGVEIPMLVILLGALGGMILAGIMGLFVGAVYLAILYQLYTRWVQDEPREPIADEEEAKAE